MSGAPHEVYVISDLHIGGRYAAAGDRNDRGFRINTHVDALARFTRSLAERATSGLDIELIINGDFFDFLAEEGSEPGAFEPFVEDPAKAIRLFHTIVRRDQVFFDALRDLTGCGGRLTLLLGNHDVELALPHVRRELLALLGAQEPSRITFLHDGEAYAVGDALIEHGNRYDGFNVIDHDALRRVRSLHSRGQPVPDNTFKPPPGSRLVASIMNPIKQAYPFVDLLKPETEAVVPILLALEPGLRGRLLEVVSLNHQASRHAPASPAMPRYAGDLAASGADVDGEQVDAGRNNGDLYALLRAAMPPEAAARFLASLPPPSVSGDLASGDDVRARLSLLRLVLSNASDDVERRLPTLLDALRAAQNDRSFDRSFEVEKPYLEAARELARRGFRYVAFGHTHLAKHIDLGEGRAYLNSGTWADLIRFPQGIVTPGNPRALEELRDFLADLAAQRFGAWIEFHPTYVRLDVRDNRVERAELVTFAPGAGGQP
jgi:UDP-2,3-diacylglucosamine pyrophosphatase LpxH